MRTVVADKGGKGRERIVPSLDQKGKLDGLHCSVGTGALSARRQSVFGGKETGE